MGRGRRKTRTGNETQSTFEKTPAIEIAILDLQLHYLKTNRPKPAMRDLLIEGISLLLAREGLSAMPQPKSTATTVIEISNKKTVA